MIDIYPIASSSAGNAYRVTDGQTMLLLEAGLAYKEIQRALDFKVTQLAGCLITHEHGDHSKSAKELMRAGVMVYTSAGTADALGLTGHRLQIVKPGERVQVGSWIILPFEIEHDAAEPLGFILANAAKDKLVFLTDTYYSRYTFPGMTHLMVECNYALDIVNRLVEAGTLHPAQKRRLLRSHFGLDNVKDMLRANDLSKLREVWLLHLSDSNSDADRFKREIQEITGTVVKVARR
ncbi:MBL fold metallo-hydrolase [Paenibacillus sp. GCM10012307]|uniref:MBL fold metallo-hydrolase n=1 Tax=Paenibacillus roseus TaxID=2798579 RepID=A0A934J5N8_9BACL|nr:MBL fold metallo-hydrolase [Paenibacillus roseus]MBJ6360832.1 MBL fold metallo-hydrolase [Paenibacillus roseus]